MHGQKNIKRRFASWILSIFPTNDRKQANYDVTSQSVFVTYPSKVFR